MLSSSAVRITLICLTATSYAIAIETMNEDEVSTRDECYWTGKRCITHCDEEELDGDYQSCRGCSIYATCTNGLLTDNRPCPESWFQWDDRLGNCTRHKSTTCKCYKNGPIKVSDIVAMDQESKKKMEATQEKLIWDRIWKKL